MLDSYNNWHLFVPLVELLQKQRDQEIEMSKYSVQLKDLKTKLVQKDSEISDSKVKVVTLLIYIGLSVGSLLL